MRRTSVWIAGLATMAVVPTAARAHEPPSAAIHADGGGLDIHAAGGRVTLKTFVKNGSGWKVARKSFAASHAPSPADTAARETFRKVRQLMLRDAHFQTPEATLLDAAMGGAAQRVPGATSIGELYGAATDAMVAEMAKRDKWARIETADDHQKRITPAANNITTHRLPGDLAIFKIRRFRGSVSSTVAERLQELHETRPLKGVIFDLRGNGGGAVEEARGLLSQFLPRGQRLLTTELGPLGRPNRTEVMTTKDVGHAPDTTLPIAVLVDTKSASASELTSGVLKDLGRARVFGDQTFGKGVGQSPRPMPDGRVYQQTEWRRRLARLGTYHGVGITPDEDTAAAHANVERGARAGQLRARGDKLMRGAILHLWRESGQTVER